MTVRTAAPQALERVNVATSAFLGPRVEALERELERSLANQHPVFDSFYDLMRYHVGTGGVSGGKRFRPLLCLLLYEGLTGDYRPALPLAAAIELMHSFTLVHDDIEDGDPLRRSRPAVWTLCGVPQGINVGDALHSLSHDALRKLQPALHSPRVRLRISQLLTRIAVRIAEGQYLDLAGTTRAHPTLRAYRFMAARKTGALIEASSTLAAALADTSGRVTFAAARFGAELGIAFQAFDDWKGMWGDAAETGKAGRADLVQRKITLPIVFALAAETREAQELRTLWAGDGALSPPDVDRVRELVERCGAERRLWTYAQERLARARSELGTLGLDPRVASGIDNFLADFKPRPGAWPGA
ncbi:MAG TPA: polyprenyl synthetase family protein [Candidatus Bathyarchaeia archaeon]|nr:polyprenyl synthetase family protein [Candidatus Bathyarchaeia archaeon]